MYLVLIFVFIIGLIIGSFLNVFILRYPKMLKKQWRQDCIEFLELPEKEIKEEKKAKKFNLFSPRSHCPHCHNPIKPWHNIPLISYILLRGRCAYCQKKISMIYPLVEAITAIASVFVISKFGLTWKGGMALIFTWGLIGLSFIDYKEQLLPDDPTLALLWLGLLCNVFYLFTYPSFAILGALVAYLFLWLISKVFYLVRQKEGMGYGDFKMFAMLGAWLGLGLLLNILLISVIVALITSLILLITKRIHKAKPIPFGPFLAFGGWVTLMYGSFFVTPITNLIKL